MIKVLNITKKPKYYIVLFTNEELLVPLDIMYKYNIKINSEYNKTTYELIKSESSFLYLKDLSLKKLKRLITTEELKTYLEKQGATQAIIKQLILDFTNKKYLDDNLYTKLFIESRKHSNGPTYFYNKLKEKGIKDFIIYENLKDFDEEIPIINLTKTKLKSYKAISNNEIKRKLKTYLLTKGFTYEKISNYIDYNLELKSEKAEIEKAYLKIRKTYEKKFSDKELFYKIKQKLYEKGFAKEVIEELLNNMQNF